MTVAMVAEFTRGIGGQVLGFSRDETSTTNFELIYSSLTDTDGFREEFAELHMTFYQFICKEEAAAPLCIFPYYTELVLRKIKAPSQLVAEFQLQMYCEIPPSTRLQALKLMADYVAATDVFAQAVQHILLQITELKREKRSCMDSRRNLEKNIALIKKEMEQNEEQIKEMEIFIKEKSERKRRRSENYNKENELNSLYDLHEELRAKSNDLVEQYENIVPRLAQKKVTRLTAWLRTAIAADIKPDTGEWGLHEVVFMGMDRFMRRYWHIRSVGGLLVHSTSNDKEEWWIVDESELLEKLIKGLNSRGRRERALKIALERLRLWLKPYFSRCRTFFLLETVNGNCFSPETRKRNRRDLVVSYTPMKRRLVDSIKGDFQEVVQQHIDQQIQKIINIHDLRLVYKEEDKEDMSGWLNSLYSQLQEIKDLKIPQPLQEYNHNLTAWYPWIQDIIGVLEEYHKQCNKMNKGKKHNFNLRPKRKAATDISYFSESSYEGASRQRYPTRERKLRSRT